MIGDLYTCAVCKRQFRQTRTVEEAVEELERIFGPTAIEDCKIVCDTCFKLIVPEEMRQE